MQKNDWRTDCRSFRHPFADEDPSAWNIHIHGLNVHRTGMQRRIVERCAKGRGRLRANEVVQLTLDDIDWRAGELMVGGKGARVDRLPLLKDVGQALADYLQKALNEGVTKGSVPAIVEFWVDTLCPLG